MLVALIPWMMAGTLSATAQTPTRDSRDAAFTERDVKFEAADGVVLAGVLLIPTGEGPFPGAVIIQGSGDSDRTNFWARSIAEALANGGIATPAAGQARLGALGGGLVDRELRDASAGCAGWHGARRRRAGR
jgi:hypothetical protein